MHKYRIEIPRYLNHAFQIDAKNKNIFWRDTIDKKIKSISMAFDILEIGEVAYVGYKKTSSYLVFDVKIDFTRKIQ